MSGTKRAHALAAVAAVAVAVAVAPPAVADSKPRVAWKSTIGGETDLPSKCSNLQSEAAPNVGADPAAPRRLRAVYQQQGESAVAGAASDDGGRTWSHHTAIPDATDCAGPADRQYDVNPLFAVGVGGTAYRGTSWAGQKEGLWSYGVVVHAWDDPESPWRATAPAGGESYAQNAALAADPKRPEVVHALWTHVEDAPNPFTYLPRATELRHATSTDGGRTFSPYSVVHRSQQGDYAINGRIVINSDGSLLVVFDNFKALNATVIPFATGELRSTLFATRSTDRGRSWSQPRLIGTPSETLRDPEGDQPVGAGKIDMAAGPDGLAAATWIESAPGGPDRVRMAVSRDGGETWSAPFEPVGSPADAIHPAVAFAGDGTVGLFWYDFRSDRPDDSKWHLEPRFAISKDAGATWEQLRLEEPFDLRATHPCIKRNELTGACEERTPASHWMAIGVQQDVTGLPHGFGAAYTVGPPLAKDGYTDAVYARVEG